VSHSASRVKNNPLRGIDHHASMRPGARAVFDHRDQTQRRWSRMMVGGIRKRRIRHFRNILAAACENILQKNNKYNQPQNRTLK
jgi:hypothetical protein